MPEIDTQRVIDDLAHRGTSELETFFLAQGLGRAFAAPDKGWGKRKRINEALVAAEREIRLTDVLRAAVGHFGIEIPVASESSPVSIRSEADYSAIARGALQRAPGSAGTGRLNDQQLPASEPLISPGLGMDDAERRRWVFLVKGRNHAASEGITALLESADLRVMEWDQAVQYAIESTGEGSPYISEILKEGMTRCRAIVVLFTADDIGSLHPALWDPNRPEPTEQQLDGRARQNVVFEAGMALGSGLPTVLVELGHVAGFSDIGGRHSIRLDDSPEHRKALLDRLAALGCKVDLSGMRWMRAGDLGGAVAESQARYRLVPEGEENPARRTPMPTTEPVFSWTVTHWRPSGVVASPHPTDLVVGCAVQVPAGGILAQGPDGRLVTRIRGEDREERLVQLLADSPVTEWLTNAASSFHVSTPLPGWEVGGYNTGESSELALEPPGPDGFPSLISAHCKVNTGWIVEQDGGRPGLVLFMELRYRLLELDAARRPDTVPHATTPPPVPAALPLEEICSALVASLQAADTAAIACTELTGTTPSTGHAALWLTSFGSSIDRVLDLTGFRTIPTSFVVGEQSLRLTLPLDPNSGHLADAAAAPQQRPRCGQSDWLSSNWENVAISWTNRGSGNRSVATKRVVDPGRFHEATVSTGYRTTRIRIQAHRRAQVGCVQHRQLRRY